jgi:hypothetical protein
MHRNYALRGLHGQRRNRCHSITIVRRESFQVGRDACATGRIEPGERQQNRRSTTIRRIAQLFLPPQLAQNKNMPPQAEKSLRWVGK